MQLPLSSIGARYTDDSDSELHIPREFPTLRLRHRLRYRVTSLYTKHIKHTNKQTLAYDRDRNHLAARFIYDSWKYLHVSCIHAHVLHTSHFVNIYNERGVGVGMRKSMRRSPRKNREQPLYIATLATRDLVRYVVRSASLALAYY
jgi:hypothetical protein